MNNQNAYYGESVAKEEGKKKKKKPNGLFTKEVDCILINHILSLWR